MSLSLVLRQKIFQHRFILMSAVVLSLSLFLGLTKHISAQTNEVACTPPPACLSEKPPCEIREPVGGWCPVAATPSPDDNTGKIKPLPSPSDPGTGTKTGSCTPKPACMYETPACAVDPAPGFVAWCPDASTSPSPATCEQRPACLDAAKPCEIREPAGGWCPVTKCEPRPACLSAAKPCEIREPAAGWCPASPTPTPTTNTCPPDLSGDGFVDLIDYGLFVPHFLETTGGKDIVLIGDFNSDGLVDLQDYYQIVQMFLKECPVASPGLGKIKPI